MFDELSGSPIRSTVAAVRTKTPQLHRKYLTNTSQSTTTTTVSFGMPEIISATQVKDLNKQDLKLQETIKQLNDEIFKDPRNKQRPPSEYLDVFNKLTEKLHSTQQNLEKLELNLNLMPLGDDTATSVNDDDLQSQIFVQSPKYDRCATASVPRINFEHSSDFLLRIWYCSSSIGNGTVVIKKQENSTLRDALSNKFKARNLDIDKCVAYLKDNNMIINWNTDISSILDSDIFVTENNGDIIHNFETHIISLRLCSSCNRRNLLNAYTCTRCKYTKCARSECRDRSDSFVCLPKTSARNINPKSDSDSSKNSGGESPYRPKNISNFSAQILPIQQISAIPSRDRSRSENELDTLIEDNGSPTATRTVPKSVANMSTSYPEKEISSYDYSTMPRQKASGAHARLPITTESRRTTKPNRRDSFNSWEIPYTQISTNGRTVGSGSFGTVQEGIDFYHGIVAIKYLKVQNPTPVQIEAFRNEVAILKTTRHDNILLFIGCISTPFLAIVTEWCKGSSLYRHLHVDDEVWSMYQLVDIAKQIGTGMEYLHARDILHRDLKSNNVFLIPDETYTPESQQTPYQNALRNLNGKTGNSSNTNESSAKWTVKIGDFGLATVKSTWTKTSAKTTNPTGSILWMAPEVITQKVPDPYTQKSDIYSFGVVLYELTTGSLPYAQKEQDMILYLVGFGRLKPNPDDARKDTPVAVKNLITKCCEYDRNKRLNFVEINSILNELQVIRLKRAASAPNLRVNYDSSTLIGLSTTDDDMYPSTPLPFDYNLASTHFTTNL